ncbi:unnamed protein product [Trichobilharzia szidati]|nr:unnamed protein product [Trichobilharzia szidati]
MSGQTKVKGEDRDDLADSSHILSLARRNFNHNNEWEDPRAYCSYSQLHSHIIPLSQRTPRSLNENFSVKSKLLSKCRYVTSESEDDSNLLKVGLQAAIKANLDYIIVINPRAINIHEDLLTKTMELLTDTGKHFQVDIVLGVTKRCSKITQSSVNINSIKVNSFNGLYLLGLKGGHSSLMSNISLLCDNVTWSSMSTADRLWNNIYHKLPTWNSVCLRERLEEVDIVLGVTKRCSKITQSSVNINSIKVNSFNGLYLLGLKGGHSSLMSNISLLCDNVTWSSMSTADRLWNNIYHKLPTWNSVCLRERLEEVKKKSIIHIIS